jgi:hypothetical protein
MEAYLTVGQLPGMYKPWIYGISFKLNDLAVPIEGLYAENGVVASFISYEVPGGRLLNLDTSTTIPTLKEWGAF